MSMCNPGYCCCGSCNLAISTVNPTPGVCQKSSSNCGGASCLTAALNNIGKLGVSVAGIVSGRATTVTASGVSVGASPKNIATVAQANAQAYLPIIIVIVAGIVLYMIFKNR